MLRKEDAVVGKRVVWRSLGTRLTPTFGTIIDVTDRGEVVIEYDDGEGGGTFIDNAASTVYPST
jgi:hypothetical protein